MNPDTAQDILDFIENHPEQHDQSAWIDVHGLSSFDLAEYLAPEHMCETTMCVAGTAVYLEDGIEGLRYHTLHGDWSRRAEQILDISHAQADALFYNLNNERAVEALNAMADDDADRFNSILGLAPWDDDDNDF